MVGNAYFSRLIAEMLFKLKNIICLLFLLFIFSCNEKGNERKPEPVVSKEPLEELSLSGGTSVELTPEVQDLTSQWLEFVTAQSEVNNYRRSGAEYGKENAAATLQIMQKLQESLPEDFKTNPVEVRINVLVTLSHLLKQESENREPDQEKIARLSRKIPEAFDHLKIQLNEVFAPPFEDFQKMLEEQSKPVVDSSPIVDSLNPNLNLIQSEPQK